MPSLEFLSDGGYSATLYRYFTHYPELMRERDSVFGEPAHIVLELTKRDCVLGGPFQSGFAFRKDIPKVLFSIRGGQRRGASIGIHIWGERTGNHPGWSCARTFVDSVASKDEYPEISQPLLNFVKGLRQCSIVNSRDTYSEAQLQELEWFSGDNSKTVATLSELLLTSVPTDQPYDEDIRTVLEWGYEQLASGTQRG